MKRSLKLRHWARYRQIGRNLFLQGFQKVANRIGSGLVRKVSKFEQEETERTERRIGKSSMGRLQRRAEDSDALPWT